MSLMKPLKTDERGVPFERTACSCKLDVQNCYDVPGPLHCGDFERITAALGITRTEALTYFRRSERSRVGKMLPGGKLLMTTVPTIVPAKRNNRCIFLGHKDRCTIHHVAPFGCAYFDVHMSAEEGHARSAWHLRQVMANQEYQALATEVAPKEPGHDVR